MSEKIISIMNIEELEETMSLVKEVFDEFEAPYYTKEGIESFYKFANYENIKEKLNESMQIFVEKDNNNEIKIAFNSKFMMEAVKSLESEEIELMFNGEIKPIILKSIESDDLIQLILPIRTY